MAIALIIEVGDDARVIGGQLNVCSDIGWCDNTMFVRIHEELEVSEQAQFRPIPSIIGLKTFDFIVRPGDYKLKSTPFSPLAGPIRRVIEKGESNGSFLLRREIKRPLFLDHVLHVASAHVMWSR